MYVRAIMKKFAALFFPLFMLVVFVGSIVYLSLRFGDIFNTGNALWFSTFSATLIFMVAGLLVFNNTLKLSGSLVYRFAALTMGYMLYLIICLILIDLINLFFPVPLEWMRILTLSLPAGILTIGLYKSFNIKVTPHQIKLSNYSNKLRVAHLSDIHIGHFRGKRFLQKLVNKVNKENPDVVVITGDFFDGKINLKDEALTPLKEIKVPIYFVNGNHDGYSGLQDVFAALANTGVHNLRNEVIDVKGIQIIGLNHMRPDPSTRDMHAATGPNMQDTLNTLQIDKNKPSILLHHSPDGIQYANEHGVDLYLSGHTHGGQQFPVTLLNEVLFTYNRGLNSYKNTKILVSEGIGTFGPPIRIGTKSEIVMIELA